MPGRETASMSNHHGVVVDAHHERLVPVRGMVGQRGVREAEGVGLIDHARHSARGQDPQPELASDDRHGLPFRDRRVVREDLDPRATVGLPSVESESCTVEVGP